MTNQELLEKMNEKVYGHLKAKKILINLFKRSKLRYLQHFRDSVPLEECLPTLNCLLIGDTGTGKTLLVETLAELIDAPLIKFDASIFNPIGNREGLNSKLVMSVISGKIGEVWQNNQKLNLEDRKYFSQDVVMHQTIIYIDEFDKMCRETNDNGWKSQIQYEFLSLFENKSEFKGLSFIFSGAFQALDKNIQKKNNPMGFINKDNHEKEIGDNLEQGLIKFGVIPEMLGRINSIVILDELNIDSYLEIIKNKLIPEIKRNTVALGINNFELPSERQLELASKAKASGLGVRGLRKEIEDLMVDLEFEAGNNELTMRMQL